LQEGEHEAEGTTTLPMNRKTDPPSGQVDGSLSIFGKSSASMSSATALLARMPPAVAKNQRSKKPTGSCIREIVHRCADSGCRG
jgi:hypothetical protein